MSDDSNSLPFQPMDFFEQFQDPSEMAEQQLDLIQQFALASAIAPFDADNGANFPGSSSAMFKAKVQSGGRMSIPGAEREALDIEEGDIVQAFIIPIKTENDND